MPENLDLASRVAEVCAVLDAEPLFHVSLGSKELFHSNFLAWFAKSFPRQASVVFGRWCRPQAGQATGEPEREARHLDLVLHLEDLAPIALENKVFSVPDEVQLDRYADGVVSLRESAGMPYSRLLLSLMDPGWENGHYNGWRLVRYSELADELSAQVGGVQRTDAFAGELLEHYIDLTRALTRLIDILGTPAPTESLLLHEDVLGLLDQIRISAGVQKARASHVARAIRTELAKEGVGVDVGYGFTNGLSLIEAYRRLPAGSSDVKPDSLGWQIQGEQFRLVVVTGAPALQGKPQRAQREAYVAENYASWFDFELLEKETGAEPLATEVVIRGGHQFHSYDPDFVYRYRKAPKLTPEQIIRIGTAYLSRASTQRPG
jgi:hypothetical protein